MVYLLTANNGSPTGKSGTLRLDQNIKWTLTVDTGLDVWIYLAP